VEETVSRCFARVVLPIPGMPMGTKKSLRMECISGFENMEVTNYAIDYSNNS
jgi:hypothetical protein